MKKLFYLIVLVVVLGLIISGCIPMVPPTEQNEPGALPSKNPGVLNVPTTTYPNIQAAIDAAISGDTIQVADGIYTITTKISVNKENIIITGNVTNPASVVVQYSSPTTNSLIFDIRANDVTVEGIKTISGKSGFYFDQGATGCKISHCIVTNARESGIFIYNGNTHTIEYTTITNPGQNGNLSYSYGVYTRADSTTIDHCTITSDKVQHMKWGVNFEAGTNHVVTETTITGAWQAAIRASAYGVKPVIITNNDIDDVTEGYSLEGAISLDGHNDGSVISGNHIDNVVSSSAIVVWSAWNITISGNQIGVDDPSNDVRLEGIRIEGCGGSGANRVEVTGNTINNTGYAAILLVSDSSNSYIYNNTITNCNNHGADGSGDWDYASIHVNDASSDVIVDSNTISDGINGIQVWGDNCQVTNNDIYNMGLTYAETKGTAGVGDGVYYNSGIIIGTNWLTDNFKPTGTTITGNNIYNNSYGLYVRDYTTQSPGDSSVLSVTATCNGWGDNSGPSGPGGTGSGDTVSLNVDYNPWLGVADAPEITSIIIDPLLLAARDTSTELEALFDSPTGGTANIDWGDGHTTKGIVSMSNEIGTVTDSHIYTDAGVYTVALTIDNCYKSDTMEFPQYVVVYDPTGGFVTGGGWIDSPVGAYAANLSLTGKATFGFVSKYKKGATVPTGNTEFQFKAGDLNFHSESYDWLVIAGAKAMYKGTGTINGMGEYKFMLSAIDADINENNSLGVDCFRIKIWENDSIIYDNQPGDDDNEAATTELGGGQIVIHKAK